MAWKKSDITIGARLKIARSNAGMTQAEVASKIGTHSRNYSKYERDEVYPSPDTLARICNALDVSADFLLGLSDDLSVRDTAKSDYILLMGSDGSRHIYTIPSGMSQRVEALLRAGVPEIMEDD